MLSSVCDTELGQAAEDERRAHGPLPARRRDALRGAMSDIACSEEPHAAGYERERIALQRPAAGRLAVLEQILSGQDVTGRVREDVLAWAPVGVRATADAQEDAVHRSCLRLARGIGERRCRERV